MMKVSKYCHELVFLTYANILQERVLMIGVEIDFIVSDSLKALDLYEKIFEVERIEVTDLPTGTNEVVFSLYGVRFHMLDENQQYGLKAPNPEHPNTIWFNITVPDIHEAYAKAMNEGCKELQGVTELTDYGVSNAIFSDPFGYVWMLHQVHEKVSFEDRVKLWEVNKDK